MDGRIRSITQPQTFQNDRSWWVAMTVKLQKEPQNTIKTYKSEMLCMELRSTKTVVIKQILESNQISSTLTK